MSNTSQINGTESDELESQSPDRGCIVVYVINETNVSFIPDYTLLRGQWIRMPVLIPANQSEKPVLAFKSISRHHGVGIKGVVCYTSDHSKAVICFRWDIPLSGKSLGEVVTYEGIDLGTYDIQVVATATYPHNYKATLHISDSVKQQKLNLLK